MSMMTQTALSDCSYPESTAYNIRDDIDATVTRLKVVIDEEASLRKVLRTLFIKRKEEAIEQVRLANLHLDLVNEEEAAFCDDLIRAAASANEGLESAGSLAKLQPVPPSFVPTSAEPTRASPTTTNSKPVEWNPVLRPRTSTQQDVCDDTAPPQSLARSTRGLDTTAPPKSLEESPVVLSNDPPRSPARSKCGLPNEPTRSPAGSLHCKDQARSPARPTRVLDYDSTPNSPARFSRGFPNDATPHSPARSTIIYELSVRGIDNGPMHISPVPSKRELPSDAPPCSPAQSARGLADAYLSSGGTPHPQRTPGTTQTSLPGFSFGYNYGAGIEEHKESPAANFSFGGGSFGTSPVANDGFGFGASTATNTGFGLGAPSQSQSAGIGFGAASLPNTGFGFGGASQTSPTVDFGLRPHRPTDSGVSSLGAPTHPMQTPVAVEDLGGSNELFEDIMKDVAGGDDWGFEVPDDVNFYFDPSPNSPKALASDCPS